jgi:hypothetical protein
MPHPQMWPSGLIHRDRSYQRDEFSRIGIVIHNKHAEAGNRSWNCIFRGAGGTRFVVELGILSDSKLVPNCFLARVGASEYVGSPVR